MTEYPQVIAHHAPSTGYFPLPWWAGLAVLCAYTAIVVRMALRREPRREHRLKTVDGGTAECRMRKDVGARP
jgi:hypothetical protein